MDELSRTICRNALAIAEGKGMSKKDFSALIKSSETTLNNVLNGTKSMGKSLRDRMSLALGVDVSLLAAKQDLIEDDKERPKTESIDDIGGGIKRLLSITEGQGKRIEGQERHIQTQADLLKEFDKRLEEQGKRIDEQGKRIDLIAEMVMNDTSERKDMWDHIKSIRFILDDQHKKMKTAAESGDISNLG